MKPLSHVEAKSWIEVVDDAADAGGLPLGSLGSRGACVNLVIESDGRLTRFRLPNIMRVEYIAQVPTHPIVNLTIGGATFRARVQISPGKSTAEDLLTEIAAARISEAKEP